MKIKSMIALSAVAAALAVPAAAEARSHGHAKPRHHARHASGGLTSGEQLELAQQQIAQLQAQVNALSARIDQAGNGGANSQMAAAASSQAADASAKADHALAVATAAQTQVATATTTAKKSLDLVSWAGNTQVHATMFADASNIRQHTAGGPSSVTGTGFNIKRIYVGVDHTFDKTFSANVTADISDVVGTSSTGNGANLGSTTGIVGKGFYVKKAYLQAKIDPALIIRVGSADLPWIPYVEGQYGHRYVENLITDEYKYGTSADWGVHVLGDLAGGLISYQVSAVDGAGYRKAYVTKRVDIEGRISAQYKGFWGAFGAYAGKLGADTQSTGATPTTYHTATRKDFAIGYKNAMFNVGGEYYFAKDYNSVTVAATEDESRGISVFGNVNITPKWQAFGRYDWVRQVNVIGSGNSVSNHYFNFGIQYEPIKIVDLSLVYKRDVALDEGVASISTQNGTIGGTTLGTKGTYDELGLFAQIKF